jgi:quinoprotein glucose dehydrogenase
MGPLFTPPSVRDAPDGTNGTLSLPFSTGGANWEGGAYDPDSGFLYVPSASHLQLLALANEPDASDIDFILSSGGVPKAFGLMLNRPPFGRITAIDLTTGEHAWWIANGDTPDSYANNPALAGVLLPRTGKPTRAGIVVTKTLLFAGEGYGTVPDTRGAPVFRAHDKMSGEIVAEIELPGTQASPPSTYMVNGRQYIVMTVSDGKSPAELIALALPLADTISDDSGEPKL